MGLPHGGGAHTSAPSLSSLLSLSSLYSLQMVGGRSRDQPVGVRAGGGPPCSSAACRQRSTSPLGTPEGHRRRRGELGAACRPASATGEEGCGGTQIARAQGAHICSFVLLEDDARRWVVDSEIGACGLDSWWLRDG
jgi:hypothetical protein